jgi:hypothetical protein
MGRGYFRVGIDFSRKPMDKDRCGEHQIYEENCHETSTVRWLPVRQIRYEIVEAPQLVYTCHCVD